jgi:hypothetical protein
MTKILDVEQKKLLKDGFEKISGAMVRTSAEKDLIKAVLSDLHEELEIDKKVLRRMSKVYFTDNFGQEKEQNREFEELFEQVTK